MADLRQVAAALLGDVVGSRTAPDRSAVHRRLTAALDETNEAFSPLVALRVTAGDEFQGCFATVGEALAASLWLRLRLAPEVDLRHGVGWGPLVVLGESPRVEDGPAWWAAREAIEAVKADASRASLRHLRTAYRRAEDARGPDPGPVNAALVCRDHLVGSLSGRSLRLLRGTLAGRSQAELAREEGVSASAVSQRIRKGGLAAIVMADELLGGVQ